MRELLWVGAGGFLGAISRYLIGGWVHRFPGTGGFPYGTLAVNALGCLVIGFLGALSETRSLFSPELRLFVFLGLLGGFTTFSSFGYETLALARDGQFAAALANIAAQLALGLAGVAIGFAAGRAL